MLPMVVGSSDLVARRVLRTLPSFHPSNRNRNVAVCASEKDDGEGRDLSEVCMSCRSPGPPMSAFGDELG